MNWREQIEAQIAECTHHAENEYDEMHYLATLLQLLLDVAVAAEETRHRELGGFTDKHIISVALDKLREVSDGD